MTVVDALAPGGVLRASINLGNPVLAQGTPEAPSGITVDLARDLAGRLGVALETICFDAAKDSFAAVRDGAAGIGFLAVDPTRAADVAFTPPYVVIEGVFAVPDGRGPRRRAGGCSSRRSWRSGRRSRSPAATTRRRSRS